MEQSRVSFLLDNDLLDKFADKYDKENNNQSYVLRKLVEDFITNDITVDCMHFTLDDKSRVLFNFSPIDGSPCYKCNKCGKIIKPEALLKVIGERVSCRFPYDDYRREVDMAIELWRSRI